MSLGNIFVNSFATIDSLVDIMLGNGNAPCLNIPKAEAVKLLSGRKYAGCKYSYTYSSLDEIPAIGIVVATAMFKLNKENNGFAVSQRDAAEKIVFYKDTLSKYPYTFMNGGLIDKDNPDLGQSLIINPDELFLVKFDADSEYGISDDIIHKEPRTPAECSAHAQPEERFIIIPHEYTKSAQVNVVSELESIRILTAQALAKALPNFNGLGQIVFVGLVTGFTYSKESLENGLSTPLHGIKAPVWSVYARPWTAPVGNVWGKASSSRKSLANVLMLSGGALPGRTPEQRLTSSVATETISMGESLKDLNVKETATSSTVVSSNSVTELPPPPPPTEIEGNINDYLAEGGKSKELNVPELPELPELPSVPELPNIPNAPVVPTLPPTNNVGQPPKRAAKGMDRGMSHTFGESTVKAPTSDNTVELTELPAVGKSSLDDLLD